VLFLSDFNRHLNASLDFIKSNKHETLRPSLRWGWRCSMRTGWTM